MRIQQHQGTDQDDDSESVNPVFPEHDREVSTEFHKRLHEKHPPVIEECATPVAGSYSCLPLFIADQRYVGTIGTISELSGWTILRPTPPAV